MLSFASHSRVLRALMAVLLAVTLVVSQGAMAFGSSRTDVVTGSALDSSELVNGVEDQSEPTPTDLDDHAAQETPVEHEDAIEVAPGAAGHESEPQQNDEPRSASNDVVELRALPTLQNRLDVPVADRGKEYASTPAGAKAWIAEEWEIGSVLVIYGEGWLAANGEEGSLVSVQFSNPVVQTKRSVINPVTGDEVASKNFHAYVKAEDDGSWSATIPFPTVDNSNIAAEWQAGQTVRVRLLSAPAQYADDTTRMVTSTAVTVIAPAVSLDVAPEFTQHPGSVVVKTGEAAVFSAAVTGEPAPTLQWQQKTVGGEWQDLPGATENSLTIAEVTTAQDQARYRAVATNSADSVVSLEASLTVLSATNVQSNAKYWAPSVWVYGEDLVISGEGWLAQNLTEGSVVSVILDPSVDTKRDVVDPVTGSVTANKQFHALVKASSDGSWTVSIPFPTLNNSEIVTAWEVGKTTRFRLAAGTLLEGDTLRVGRSGVITVVEPLNVSLSAPEFTAQPASVQVDEGERATFGVTAVGQPTPTIQWQVKPAGGAWQDISGETANQLVVSNANLSQNQHSYRAVATNSVDSVVSHEAMLTVNELVVEAPTITLHPRNTAAGAGQDVQLVAAASGSPSPTVQWQSSQDGISWQNIAGQTNVVLRLTNVQLAHNGQQYRAIFTNVAGSAATIPAQLTVSEGLVIEIVEDGPYYRGDIITVKIRGAEPGTPNVATPRTAIHVDVVTADGELGFGRSVPGAAERQPDADGNYQVTVMIPYFTSDYSEAVVKPGEQFPLTGIRVRAKQDDNQFDVRYHTPSFDLTARSGSVHAPTFVGAPSPIVGNVYQTVSSSITYTGGEGTTVVWMQKSSSAQSGNESAIDNRNVVNQNGVSTANILLASDRFVPGGQFWAVAMNDSGYAISVVRSSQLPAAPVIVTDLSESLLVGVGEPIALSAHATGAPLPSAVWEQSADGQTWVSVGADANIHSTQTSTQTRSTLSIDAADTDNSGTKYRATFSNGVGVAAQTKVLTLTVSNDDVPADVVLSPVSQTIEAGEAVTFTAQGLGVPVPAIQWERSVDGGQTWAVLRNATSTSYSVDKVKESESGYLYRARFTNRASVVGAVTDVAELTVTPRENRREYCGASYGPVGYAGTPFCVTGPEKVIWGEDIVLTGTGYLSTNDVTGSVVNFFLDALYSGDPNTILSKQNFTNPATGRPITDPRTNAVVQANGTGGWTATIKWPTVNNVDLTQGEIDTRFAVGTTHSIRILTGSLLSDPIDRQRGASAFFTVVSSLQDEVSVSKPIYSHFTYESELVGDSAIAWVPTNADSGATFKLTGTGWLTQDHAWGSAIAVRLQNERGDYYQRSGDHADQHVDPADPTVWQYVQAAEDGVVDTAIAVPSQAKAGDYLAVELTTVDDGTAFADVERHWVSEALSIDEMPYIPELGSDATCVAGPTAYSYELAPGMKVPAANVGGTIRLVGENWCNLVGGGSLIAVKINAGGYSHKAGESAPYFDANVDRQIGLCPANICLTNKTIWYVIEADEKGSFDVEIPLPNRANSVPGFAEGSYTLQLLTRTISADSYYAGSRPDPSRSLQTPEFTVVAEGVTLDNVAPGKPSATPTPLHVDNDLSASKQGGVSVTQRAQDWLVTVPQGKPGDWVYVNVYDGASPRFPWGAEWFQLDNAKQVALPLAGATLPSGTNKLSVQNRLGDLLGWTTVTVAAPAPALTPLGGGATGLNVGLPKPTFTPAEPVVDITGLNDANVGTVTAVQHEGQIVISVPGVAAGHWVYLFLYTADGRVVGVDWVQVGTDHTITVEVGALPTGLNKIALVDQDQTLVGWVNAPGEEVDEPEEVIDGSTNTPVVGPDGVVAAPALPSGTSDSTQQTLLLIGASVLILAGAAAAVIRIRTKAGA